MPKRQPRTLLELIYARTGSLRDTYHVGMLIEQWALCRRDLGRRPTVEQYSAWWKQTERTSYRQLARFARAFPEEDGPDRIAMALSARADELAENLTAIWVLGSPPAVVAA